MYEVRESLVLDDPFQTPILEVLFKAQEEGGKRVFYVEASNEDFDDDGESLSQIALKEAQDFFLQKGVISWDHQHKMTKDPNFIIGEPIETRFTSATKTLVKGWLYEYNDIANGVWNNLRSGGRRYGASVGGGILRKSQDGKQIQRVVWDELAITYKPVHSGTLGTLTTVPFPAFMKALMAGTGVDAGAFTGGRALTGESLQGSTVATGMPDPEELQDLFSVLIKAIADGRIGSYRRMREFIEDQGYDGGVAARLVQFMLRKLPETALR